MKILRIGNRNDIMLSTSQKEHRMNTAERYFKAIGRALLIVIRLVAGLTLPFLALRLVLVVGEWFTRQPYGDPIIANSDGGSVFGLWGSGFFAGLAFTYTSYTLFPFVKFILSTCLVALVVSLTVASLMLSRFKGVCIDCDWVGYVRGALVIAGMIASLVLKKRKEKGL